MQFSRYFGEPREIVVSSVLDGSLLGDGPGQPVEGFSDSQADRNHPRADCRVSVHQAAKCDLFANSLGSFDVTMSSSAGMSSSSSVSSIASPGVLGLRRQVGLSRVDRNDSFRPAVVVGRLQHSRGSFSRHPSYRPSLLVRHVGPGLGRSHRRPVCFGLVVSRGDRHVHQSLGVEGHTSRSSAFSVSTGGFVGRGVC